MVQKSKEGELYTTVKHFANLGDAIAVMGAVKKYYDVTSRKVMFCQTVNQEASYYPGQLGFSFCYRLQRNCKYVFKPKKRCGGKCGS